MVGGRRVQARSVSMQEELQELRAQVQLQKLNEQYLQRELRLREKEIARQQQQLRALCAVRSSGVPGEVLARVRWDCVLRGDAGLSSSKSATLLVC